MMITFKCAECGIEFKRRSDHKKALNFCSYACSGKSRKVEGARWRDPLQIKAYMREYVKENREEHNRRGRKWNKANREKKAEGRRMRRAASGRITADQWSQLKREYGPQCPCCRLEKPLELDHIVPVSKGGLNTIENAQPLCRSCNASKGASTIRYTPVYRLKAKLFRDNFGFSITEVSA